MRLLIFAGERDKTAHLIFQEAESLSLESQVYYYPKLFFRNGKIFWDDRAAIDIKPADRIILLDPSCGPGDFSFFVWNVVSDFGSNILLDQKILRRYPMHEDKAFQADFFSRHAIRFPRTWLTSEARLVDVFPVILKRRVGSGAKGYEIMGDEKALERGLLRCGNDYIVQEYKNIVREFRVLVFQHRVLGTVVRSNRIVDGSVKAIVTTRETAELPDEAYNQAVLINRKMGADLLGHDVMLAEDGKYYFLESNRSPQLGGFQKTTGVNVVREIVELAKKSATIKRKIMMKLSF